MMIRNPPRSLPPGGSIAVVSALPSLSRSVRKSGISRWTLKGQAPGLGGSRRLFAYSSMTRLGARRPAAWDRGPNPVAAQQHQREREPTGFSEALYDWIVRLWPFEPGTPRYLGCQPQRGMERDVLLTSEYLQRAHRRVEVFVAEQEGLYRSIGTVKIFL